MINKSSNFVFLILLFLLQSCSGGRISSFLESSFKNNNSNKISQNDSPNNIKNNIVVIDKNFLDKQVEKTTVQSSEGSNPKILDKISSVNTNDPYKIKKQNQNYKPKSYRIFVILKKVDPSFPTENFSKVLKNGNINFEIEKIELIPELNQNKK